MPIIDYPNPPPDHPRPFTPPALQPGQTHCRICNGGGQTLWHHAIWRACPSCHGSGVVNRPAHPVVPKDDP